MFKETDTQQITIGENRLDNFIPRYIPRPHRTRWMMFLFFLESQLPRILLIRIFVYPIYSGARSQALLGAPFPIQKKPIRNHCDCDYLTILSDRIR